MTRKEIIEELECLRQGFKNAHDLYPREDDDPRPFLMSMDSCHHLADKVIVRLGGESVREDG
jgi:hypothetical protein